MFLFFNFSQGFCIEIQVFSLLNLDLRFKNAHVGSLLGGDGGI